MTLSSDDLREIRHASELLESAIPVLIARIDALEVENKDLRRKIADGITRWGG